MLNWGMYRDGVDPGFADDCDACLGPLPTTYNVVAGFRSIAKETELYAQGRTTPGEIVTWAKPGTSAHGYGLAIDVVPASGSYDTTRPEWQNLFAAVRAAPHLHSGEDFPPGETDAPHIERLNWRLFISGS